MMRRGLSSFLLSLAAAAPLAAQEPSGPAELNVLRAGFQESISAADRAVKQHFAESLLREEKEAAAGGDYTLAARLRELRESFLSSAGTADGRISCTLDVTRIKHKGSGLASPESGNIKFTSSSAFLEWELTGEFKGWYEVLLTHGVDGSGDRTADVKPVAGPLPEVRKPKSADYYTPAGGWVDFEKISSLTKGLVLHREIVSTGGWNTMRQVSLGRLELNGSQARLRLTAREALKDGLMNFKSIELVPSTAPSGQAGGPELAKAREEFEKAFQTVTADTNKTYRDALNRMAASQKDTDALARIKREIARLDAAPARLAFSSGDDDGTGGSIVLLPGSGIDWKLRGDVRHDGSKKVFTLLRPAGTAAITWRLAAFSVPSGLYSVTIKGRAPVNGGGTASLTATGSGNIAGKPLAVKIDPVVSVAERNKKPAAGYYPPQPESRMLEAGPLVIPKGSEFLTLTVDALTHADGSLLDLASIELTRTGDIPPPKNP